LVARKPSSVAVPQQSNGRESLNIDVTSEYGVRRSIAVTIAMTMRLVFEATVEW
jgi:hypothetical protein